MDLEAANAALTEALTAGAPPEIRFRAARAVLAARGGEIAGVATDGLSLDTVVRLAAAAPRSDPRRMFAVLLVHAIGVPGLLPLRGESGAQIQQFLESALLNPLRRAGYPFGGSAYDKRQALEALHTTIDAHLNEPEPSIPHWIHRIGDAPP